MDKSTTEDQDHIILELNKVDSLTEMAKHENTHLEKNSILLDDIDEIDGRNVHIPSTIPETDDENDEHAHNSHISLPRRPSTANSGYTGLIRPESNGVIMPTIDVNAYQHKKTLAQGMMDLALLSANANQFRYVLDSIDRHPYGTVSLIFISLSIIFQILVGIGLILNGRLNIKDEKEICRANKINNYTVFGIFLITIVNIFIASFGVADESVNVK